MRAFNGKKITHALAVASNILQQNQGLRLAIKQAACHRTDTKIFDIQKVTLYTEPSFVFTQAVVLPHTKRGSADHTLSPLSCAAVFETC